MRQGSRDAVQRTLKLFQSVAVTAGDGVGRFADEFSDLREGKLFPDFEDDDFRLFAWEATNGVLYLSPRFLSFDRAIERPPGVQNSRER